MKKTFRIISICLILLLVSGCTATVLTPEDTLEKFTDAVKGFHIEKMSALMDQYPTNENTGMLINVYDNKSYVELYKKAQKNLSYTIKEVTPTETGATISLQADIYDLQTAYGTALMTMAAQALEDPKLMEEMLDESVDITHYIPDTIVSMLDSDKVEKKSKTFTLQLLKTGEKYYLQNDSQLRSFMTAGISDAIENIAGKTDTSLEQ